MIWYHTARSAHYHSTRMTAMADEAMDIDVEHQYTDYNFTGNVINISFQNTSNRRLYIPRRMHQPDPMIIGIYKFSFYCYPVILSVGSLGNILAYLVFTRTRLKKVSSIQYLAAMTVTDTGFLWTFFLTPLYGYYKVPIIVQDGLCQFMTFLNYVFTFLSIWYLAAMVVEKFIGVYWPLKKSSMCTPFRAKLVMFFMSVIAVACYSYVVYFFGPDKFQNVLRCMPWKELRFHFHNLSKIDTFVVAILPYSVIILLTILIVIRGCEYYRISASVEIWTRSHGSRVPSSQSSVRVTNILFPVIILTVLGNFPVMILRTAMTLNGVRNPTLAKWNHLFYVFYILNFGIKCFVYLVFSGSFRRRTRELFRSGFNKMKDACNRKHSVNEADPQRIHLDSMSRGAIMRSRLMQSDI